MGLAPSGIANHNDIQLNARARRFYEKHGFRWDGTERASEFDGALEVRYVREQLWI